MIRVLNKKQQKEANKPRFTPPDNLPHETEIAARALQEKLTENDRLVSLNSGLSNRGEVLKNENITLKFDNERINKDNEDKRKELIFINNLIVERSTSLNLLNNTLSRVSVDYNDLMQKSSKVASKIKKIEDQYSDELKKYDELTKKIREVDKERKKVAKELKLAKTDSEKSKVEASKKWAEFEEIKHQQSNTLKQMKFYADRINRFYRERQMKPPIKLLP